MTGDNRTNTLYRTETIQKTKKNIYTSRNSSFTFDLMYGSPRLMLPGLRILWRRSVNLMTSGMPRRKPSSTVRDSMRLHRSIYEGSSQSRRFSERCPKEILKADDAKGYRRSAARSKTVPISKRMAISKTDDHSSRSVWSRSRKCLRKDDGLSVVSNQLEYIYMPGVKNG
jgi:hypothetical protein